MFKTEPVWVVFEESIPDRGNLVDPPFEFPLLVFSGARLHDFLLRRACRIALLHFPEEAFLLKVSLVTLRRLALTWIDNFHQRRCCEHEEHRQGCDSSRATSLGSV
jgi:hypothetical protein